METKIKRLRKALTQAAMEVASDGSDNIKNYEIAARRPSILSHCAFFSAFLRSFS